MNVVLSYEAGEGREWRGIGKTTKERREVREREKETERQDQGLKKMERSGKANARCGFDFSCQSSVISENQSHMS